MKVLAQLALVALVSVALAQQKDDKKNDKTSTRFLGGGGGLLGGLSNLVGGGLGGGHGGGFQQGGFQQGGFHQQGGFGQGGFGQGGFGQGGFGQGGFGQGGFGQAGLQGGFGGAVPLQGGGGFGNSGGTNCRYWCKTPQNQNYCCENNQEIPSAVGIVKPGYCPPVRPTCPPTRSGFGGPKTCSNDGSCGGYDKCCYDTCLEQHICKQPISTFG